MALIKSRTDTGSIIIKMVVTTRESGKMTWCMDKESSAMLMVPLATMVHSKMTNSMYIWPHLHPIPHSPTFSPTLPPLTHINREKELIIITQLTNLPPHLIGKTSTRLVLNGWNTKVASRRWRKKVLAPSVSQTVKNI